MRIRKRFIITMVLFSIVLAVIAVSAIITHRQIGKADEQEKIASSIAQGVSELSYLSNDYLIYRENQQLMRWQSRFASFSNQVASFHVDKLEQQVLVDNIQTNQKRLKEVFDNIVSAVENSPNQAGVLDPAFIRVSWGRMAVQSQGLISDASRLSQVLHQQMDQLTTTRTMLMYTLVVLFSVFLLTNYMLTYRRILKSIETLRGGTVAIGSGNLDFVITGMPDDELGDLSQAFSQMSVNLKEVTASKADLEKEVLDRKRVEEALRQSESKYRIVAENPYDWEFWITPEGKYIYVSPSCKRITRRDADEFIKNSALRREIIFPEDLPIFDRHRQEEEEEEVNPREVQHRILHTDGTVKWIGHVCKRIFDDKGQYLGIRGTNRDITERKRAEEDLRESERQHRLLAQVGELGANLTNTDELIEAIGERVAKDFGVSRCGYSLVDIDAGQVTIMSDYHNNFPPIAGVYPIAEYMEHWQEDGLSGRTAAIEDVATHPRTAALYETKFAPIQVRAHLTVPLHRDGRWVANFWASHHEPRRWTPVEIGLMKMIAERVWIIVERRRVEEALRQSAAHLEAANAELRASRAAALNLMEDADSARRTAEQASTALRENLEERTREVHEKEVLLKEVHHRVKNNLQVISSLVSLQADGSGEQKVREMLKDVTYRVRSMALVHEKLYQSADLGRINFPDYARSLLSYLWRGFGAEAASVRMTFDMEPVSFPVDIAVPCGLILNELASNALKHAFQGRTEGEVTVTLKGSMGSRISLSVRDNGVGLPPGFDWRQARSLGLRLVQMLAGQLDATVQVRRGDGTEFEIVFGT